MIATLSPYAGDLHQAFADQPFVAAAILVLCSAVSGIAIGLERERRDKPAGMRTVSLIAVGSTIFTLASIYIAGDFRADSARIAAQVVTGVGFLGAGAIIRDRGMVVGMTTGATVWAVAAIGVLIGAGYAVGGLGMTLLVLALLTLLKRIERAIVDPCSIGACRLVYEPDNGKTRVRILRILDGAHVPYGSWTISRLGELEAIDIRYCRIHRHHRLFLAKLVNLARVREFHGDYGPPLDEGRPQEFSKSR